MALYDTRSLSHALPSFPTRSSMVDPYQLAVGYAGPASPTSTTGKSPFLAKAPLLDDLPPKLALTFAQLANSLETLAAQYPLPSPAVQQNPTFGNAFASWLNLVLPLFSAFDRLLTQLRDVAEDVWRAAGGFIAASAGGSVTVDVDQLDPEGGSHLVAGRERLAPASPASLASTVEKMRQTAMLFLEIEQKVNQVSKRLVQEAERYREDQFHVKTLLHAAAQLATFPRQFYQVLGPLSSDASVRSGIWYHPSEARAVFRSYRRIDETLSHALTQSSNANELLTTVARKSGYLGPLSASPVSPYAAVAGPGYGSDGRRAHTFPSLQGPVEGTGMYRSPSAGGRRSSLSGYESGYGVGAGGGWGWNGGAAGGMVRPKSRTR
ncbi:hypothetical protein JCM8097_008947 [Rhodosporidiobolus ruineniae]